MIPSQFVPLNGLADAHLEHLNLILRKVILAHPFINPWCRAATHWRTPQGIAKRRDVLLSLQVKLGDVIVLMIPHSVFSVHHSLTTPEDLRTDVDYASRAVREKAEEEELTDLAADDLVKLMRTFTKLRAKAAPPRDRKSSAGGRQLLDIPDDVKIIYVEAPAQHYRDGIKVSYNHTGATAAHMAWLRTTLR